MSSKEEFTVTHPLPGRNAFGALRQQIVEYLMRVRPEPGTPFLSDNQLAQAAKLARNTVRRAVDQLITEGWIERRHGKGTFVGPRVATVPEGESEAGGASTERAVAGNGGASRRVVRLAVLLGYPAGGPSGWYSIGVLQGLEEAAVSERISIEMYNFGSTAEHIRQRLSQSRPDVLACLSPPANWALMVAEARARGVPVVLTGTRLASLDIPTIYEDGAAGAAAAVRHLLEHGHRRIAFVQDTVPTLWAFDRFHGYIKAMLDAGLDPDDGLNIWVNQEYDQPDDGRLGKMLDRVRPTAVLLGSGGLMRFFAPAIAERKLRVPEDISLVCFDQISRRSSWLPGREITIVALPLREMGQLIARHAREISEGIWEGGGIKNLPCTLIPGDTVRRI